MNEMVLTFVVNAAWQAAAIALAGFAALALLRRAPAAVRFRLAAAMLAACVAAPAASLLPRTPVPHGVAAAVLAPRETTAGALTVIFIAGMCAAALRLAAAAVRARRLLREATPFGDGIRISDAIASPVTIGRTIVLPSSLVGSDLAGAALAHEAAHVGRRDFAVNALLEFAAIPLWFHPAAWLLRRRIAELRELACDEEAARVTSRRSYAAALVRIASLARSDAFALGMASSPIERRVAALCSAPRRSAAAARATLVAVIVLPLGGVVACSRSAVSPEVAHSLAGRWTLVKPESDFSRIERHPYDGYTMAIEQRGHTVAVQQRRVIGTRTRTVNWRVVADGKWRPLDGIAHAQGRAVWRDGRLEVSMSGPGAHSETAVTTVRDGKLICDGATERGRFHAVFQRED